MKNSSTKQIMELIKEGKQDELSQKLLLHSLKEQGIHDLDGLLEQALKSCAQSQAKPLKEILPGPGGRTPEEAVAELLFGAAALDGAKQLGHATPKLPFVLGGANFKPAEVKRFNGQVLHYVWDSELIGHGFLRATTDPDEYRAFLENPPAPESRAALARNHVPGTGHTFYQHINYGGYSLSLAYRHGRPDLTRVTMSGWWFWATSWNDQISSLRTGSGPVILADNIMNPYLTGPTMTVPAFGNIPWIGQAWNDRVSAILG